MKIKTRLTLACSMFALVIFTVVAGVLAVTTLNFNIGGSINFTAKGINATISAGTLSATGSHVTASDADNKMKQIVLSTKTEVPNHSANVASWTGLNLLFNENGDDVTITFTIKNDAETGSTDKVYTKITTTAGSGATNATVSVNTPTTEIAAQATKTFVITFHITEPSLNAELPNFVITVDLAQESFAGASLSYDDYLTGPNTVAVSGFDNSETSVEIPETITKDGTTYSVTTIKSSAFANNTVIQKLTIPSTITTIEPKTFAGCTNLSDVTFENTSNWHISITADSTYGTALSVTNSATNIANLTTNYCNFYIKSGTFTQALTMSISAEVFDKTLGNPVENTFYLQYTEGMTWQDLIDHEILKYVINKNNDIVGTIVVGSKGVRYTYSGDTTSGMPSPSIDTTIVSATSIIDSTIEYTIFADFASAPLYLQQPV